MLNLYRRHTGKCPHRAKGAAYTKCSCPIWCDGELNGRRRRESLKTRDWQRAIRKVAALEDPNAPLVKPIGDAITAFQNHIQVEESTRREYRNVFAKFGEYCKDSGLRDLAELTVERLDAYRAGRSLAPTTSMRELGTLRQFLTFCQERRWIADNPAKRIKGPRNAKPAEVVPFTTTELGKMVAACDGIGRGPYERLRAKAMVLLLRYTGLRISDVASLSRDRVQGGQILLHTQKTGGTVFLPIPGELQDALDTLPAPRNAKEERWFFWNGGTTKRAVVGTAQRTLAAVFTKSGVEGAHAHRFRHTLATEILARGGSEQDAADILGISAAVVRKHYAKWSQARQQRITRLFEAIYPGTYLVHEEKGTLIN
jgi:site-specific recombinase XerD